MLLSLIVIVAHIKPLKLHFLFLLFQERCSFFDRVKKVSPVKMAERFVAVFANYIHLEALKHLFHVFGSCGYSGFILYRSSAGRQRRSRSSRKRCQLNQFSLMLLCLVCFLTVCCLCPACCVPPPPFNDPSILDIIVLHFHFSPFISPRHSPLEICIYLLWHWLNSLSLTAESMCFSEEYSRAQFWNVKVVFSCANSY